MASAGNGASHGELLKQTVPVLTVLPHTLFTSTQSLVLASTSQPPQPPPPQLIMDPLSHSICLASHALSQILPFILSFLSFPLFFFFTPIFTSDTPLTPSHTISIKGKLSRPWQVFSLRVCVCVCERLHRDRQSEGRSAWSLQGDTREERLEGIKY